MVYVTTYYLSPHDIGVVSILMSIAMPAKAFAPAGAGWVIGGNYFSLNEDQRSVMIFNVISIEIILRSLMIILFLLADVYF